MKNPTIGIKIADGSYFPIMEEGSSKRKRLVLTTVTDNQESVQIDLYKGDGDELLNAVYVGSLLIENIAQGPKESSEIELKLGFDQDGTLNAEAGDSGSGQFESISISMETLGESSMYDVPEFSLDDEMEDLQIDDIDTEIDLDSEDLSLDDVDLEIDPDSEELTLNDEMKDLQIDDFDSLGEELPVPELVEGDSEGLSFDDIMEEETPLPDSSVPEPAEGVEGDLDSDELSLDDDDFDFDDMEEDDSLEAEDFDLDEELSEEEPGDIFEESPDSNLDDEEDDDEDSYTPGILSESEMIHRKEKKGGNPFLVALLVIITIAAIAGISYLLFRSLQGEDSPKLEAKAQTESTEVTAEDAVPQTESTNEEQPIDDTTTVPEPAVQESTRITDTTGVWYKIRWGDTLWGISYSFYESPRDYNKIVKENKIKNPDIIFAETEIFIPSK